MRTITFKRLTLATAIAGVFTISGCGGGSSSASTAATSSDSSGPATVSGVAATGAPLASATVTLTDAAGNTKTATTDANGAYTMDVSGMTAPFVVTVRGISGDTEETLASVQATAPGANQTITVNVTPLTHAVAAALSSNGDPLALDPAQNKDTITGNISAVKSYITQIIANPLNSASVDTSNFDPVNTKFSADHSGLDKVIDNLQVSVEEDGTVSLLNKGASSAMVDDMAQASGTPTGAQNQQSLGATVVTFKAGTTNFAQAPGSTLESGLVDNSIADQVKNVLNQCFAGSAAQRGSISSIGSACQSLASAIDSSYLNDGKSASQEFDGLLANSGMDNATFQAPQIIRFYTADRALVSFGFQRANGTLDSITTVVKNVGSASAPSWKLYGNQRNYSVMVNAVAAKRSELNPSAAVPSSYQSGLNLHVGANANISYVKVTGPGLGAGVVLKPSLGSCNYLTIVDNNGNTAAAQTNACASVYRLTGVAQSDTATFNPWGNGNPIYAPAAVPDSTIQSIHPFDAYLFDIVDTSNNHTFVVSRLQSRPLTTTELPMVHYNVIADATKALLVPGTASSFAGGTSIDIGWAPQAHTAPVDHINVQMRPSTTGLVQNNVAVPLSATFTSEGKRRTSASYTVSAPGSSSFAAASAATGALNFAQLTGHNAVGRQIIASTQYSN